MTNQVNENRVTTIIEQTIVMYIAGEACRAMNELVDTLVDEELSDVE